MAAKLDLQPMGAREAAEEARREENRQRLKKLQAQYIDEACSECGQHGGISDGRYHYCAEHLPPGFYDARDEAEAFTRKMRAEGTPWPPRTNNYRGPEQGT